MKYYKENDMVDLTKQFGNNLSYGGNVAIPTSEFTRETQQRIVNNYFNPSANGGAYEDVLRSMAGKNEQPAVQQNTNTVTVDNSELERLKRIEQLVSSGQYQPFNNASGMQNTVQNQTNENQQSTNPATESEDPIAKFMREFNKPEQTVQAPHQNQEQDQQAAIINELSREATLKGYNPQEVIQFASQLTPQDLVTIFDAMKQAQAQPQVQPQVQAQPQAPINLSEMPAPNTIQTSYIPSGSSNNPFFR